MKTQSSHTDATLTPATAEHAANRHRHDRSTTNARAYATTHVPTALRCGGLGSIEHLRLDLSCSMLEQQCELTAQQREQPTQKQLKTGPPRFPGDAAHGDRSFILWRPIIYKFDYNESSFVEAIPLFYPCITTDRQLKPRNPSSPPAAVPLSQGAAGPSSRLRCEMNHPHQQDGRQPPVRLAPSVHFARAPFARYGRTKFLEQPWL